MKKKVMAVALAAATVVINGRRYRRKRSYRGCKE